ncbi:DUF2188 domain-containing protein [Sphingobium lactosutens]|uniref:DUF2188 domain-containing protein n=1 Tax=Sphingobium lactosutens TaxID=522773 RepID=UPI0015BA77AA|nr:DUF2188 domain-containing protein [Sphingobium lactosutens]NWK96940.1 DUF2188 domain-containing protein [Sphingobium lactosutens]
MPLPPKALPHARYIVLEHEGAWKINLDNSYYGPFTSQAQAVETATDGAQKAAQAGYPASVLLMTGTNFETLWTNIEA